MKPRIVFMGTPEFALPSVERLASEHALVGVVTQPDRPAGRGRKVSPSPVKEFALAEGIPVFQPPKLRRVEAVEHLRGWSPDLIVVAAYGQILPPSVLEIPRFGVLNVHASLLPRWRGAAPVQGAILAGDTVTGVTIMKMDEGLDTGPILAMREVPVGPEETAGELETRLAEVGAALLIETLPDYLAGRLTPQPQPTEGVTVVRRIPKKAAQIDWTQPAETLFNQVRAFAPKPGAYTTWQGARLKVLRAQPIPTEEVPDHKPGYVFLWTLARPRGKSVEIPAVVTEDGGLALLQVQMAGKRPMAGEAFVRGRKDFVGATVGSQKPGD